MSRFLAIDWDHEQLCVVEATCKGGKTVVQRAFRWPETVSPNPVQAEEAGRRLRARLKEAGIAAAPVLYAIGRDRVVVRDVRYPDAPAHEVPAIVRMQASKDLPFPVEEAVIDYSVSKFPGPRGDKRALAVILRKELLGSIQKTMATAGLKLEGLSLRPFGIVASGQSTVDGLNGEAGEALAMFAVNNGSSEFCISRQGELLFSRVVGAGRNGDDGTMNTYVPELRRTLAAYGGQFPQYPIKTMLLAGVAPQNGKEDLAAALRLKVVPMDPLDKVAFNDISESDRGVFAGMVGLLQSAGSPNRLPVNFLSPKRPEPPKSNTKWIVVLSSLLALMLIGAVVFLFWRAYSEADLAAAEQEAENMQLKKKLAAYGDLEVRMKAVEDQTAGELVIVDEVYDLIAKFPDVGGVRVVEYTCASLERKKEQKAAPGLKPAGTAPAKQGTIAAKTHLEPIGQLKLVLFGSNDGLARIRKLLETDRHLKFDEKDWTVVRDLKDNDKCTVTATLPIFPKEAKDYVTVVKAGVNKTANADGSGQPPRRPTRPGRSN